jgi:uncharacterized protein YuzE
MHETRKIKKIDYDEEVDILSIDADHADYKYSIDLGKVIVDFDRNDVPIGLEILDASKTLGIDIDILNNIRSAMSTISVDLEKNDIKVILAVIYENEVSKTYSFKDTLSHPLPASETAMV